MKVVWFAHRDIFNPLAGGAERTINEVGKRLTSMGHEFHVITSMWKEASSYDVIDGVQVHRFYGNILSHIMHSHILKKFISSDIVVDDLGHVVPWNSERGSDKPGVVLFRHLHARTLKGQVNTVPRYFLQEIEKTYKYVYPHWDFITESKGPAEDLINLGIGEQRIKIIRPGVDHDKFKPSTRDKEMQLIYFAGMRDYKRPDYALKTFKILAAKNRELKLVMVGDGPSIPKLKVLATNLGVSDRVIFKGRLDDDSLINLIQTSLVNIHCSVEEGWCYSPLEAAACGVPTAAFYNMGLSDEILDNQSGKFAADGNIIGLSVAIQEILDNLDSYSRNAYQFSKRFSWDESAKLWESLLMEKYLLGR
ncbi:MAG: glycosyltransferase family 4 protein [Thermoplasmatales archaeon]|nr:glycosyltransferase family 4 protein [Thermoplasmatales archaeon]